MAATTTDLEKGHQPQISKADTARETRDYKKRLRKMIRKFERAEMTITDAAAGADGFDIFQITAFLAKHTTFLPDDVRDRMMAARSSIKKRASLKKAASTSDADGMSDDAGDEDESNGTDFTEDEESMIDEIADELVEDDDVIELSHKVDSKDKVQKRDYWWAIFKSVCVATLQVVSLLAICWELIGEVRRWEDICPHATPKFSTVPEGMLKYMSCGFTLFIGMNVLYLMRALRNQGMYSAITYSGENMFRDLVDGGWLLAGQSINMIVLFWTVWTSFVVIFVSEDVLDMVMNSVALYFVLELDNLVIGIPDYKTVERYLEHYHWDIDRRADEWVRKELSALEADEQVAHDLAQKHTGVRQVLTRAVIWFLTVALMAPLMWTTAFASLFVVPIYMLFCK